MTAAWIRCLVMTGVVAFAAAGRLGGQTDSASRRALAPRPFIGRIVGVFDISTGEPIEGVEVLDLASKSSALTTATGTVALTFVDSVGSIIRLRKVGYEPLTMTIANHESDPPITAVMTRTGVVLATVVTTANRHRTPADTVRKLELNGFYDRRETSGAAAMAFVMGEKIQNMSTFDDFQALTGRPICTANLWVDGIRVTEMKPGRGNRFLRKNSADQVVLPNEVVAVENYRVSEVPVQYNSTKPGGASNACGATLIWTK